MKNIGLIGTITHDRITFALENSIEGLGGILYQAAVLSGLDKKTSLYTNLGGDLKPEVWALIENWPALETGAVQTVPGPGNRVNLHYPQLGEREEVLETVVPPLDPTAVLADGPYLDILIAVLNSGFDIGLADWRSIIEAASFPVWLDIHSLALSPTLGSPRSYRPLPEWKDWAAGVTYLQANSIEIACMLGLPCEPCTEADQDSLAGTAFDIGVKAVFVTSGQKGVRVLTPEKHWWISTQRADKVADTTGCGDIFCAGTVAKLVEGHGLSSASAFGAKLATAAVEVAGIEATYRLARSWKSKI